MPGDHEHPVPAAQDAVARQARRAYLLLGLLCLVILGAEVWSEWSRREAQLREVQTASANLARSLVQEADGAIAAADAALVAIVERLEEDGTGPESLERLRRLLAAASANQPMLRGFAVDGRDGVRLVSSVAGQTLGVSSADRDYFRHHHADPDPGPYLGPPVRSRRTGEWIMTISRRLQDREGNFAGVVVTTVPSAVIARIYSAFDVGRQGSITLLHMNGMIMSRRPFDDAVIGRILPLGQDLVERARREPRGWLPAVSGIDGVSRLISYERSERFPLIVAVSPGTEEALAAWVRGVRLRGTGVLAVVAVILALGLRLIAQMRRRRQAELVLAQSEAQFRMLAEHASDMVSRVGADGRRRYASPAAARLLGMEPGQLVGRRPEENIHPDDRAEFGAAVASLREGQEQAGLAYRARRADGREIWIESNLRLVRDPRSGAPDGYVGISRDVTVTREAEARLAELAATDGLTGIANRRRFDEELTLEWRRAAREGTPLAVMLLDVDHFKRFNDRYGHPAGDDCLRRVAAAIATSVRRPGDRPARYGGEEFAVILPATDLPGVLEVAERVRAAIQGLGIPHEGHEAGMVTASIGLAVTRPGPSIESAALLATADQALYEAKRAGRNRVAYAAPEAAAATSKPDTAAPENTLTSHQNRE